MYQYHGNTVNHVHPRTAAIFTLKYILFPKSQSSHLYGFLPNEDISMNFTIYIVSDPNSRFINIWSTYELIVWASETSKVTLRPDFTEKYDDICHPLKLVKQQPGVTSYWNFILWLPTKCTLQKYIALDHNHYSLD